ncbi:MAG: rhodanese-like domain-containing protein [Candidatus Gastranaerophilales bacterium]|nr:rhodanese-like domain-containing protein [Candidatus Gastranaerophilales bacterium]
MDLNSLVPFLIIGFIIYIISKIILKGVKEEPPNQIMNYLYKPGCLFVDVRENDKFFSAHIPKSVNIPISELKYSFSKISNDKQLILISRSGKKSKAAINILKDNGYTTLINLKGGLVAWQKAGYPLECGGK